MLYLVATPIGNLRDITHRAIEVLQNCTYILCEDTRHSHILLQHYQIKKPLKSYHKFNEAEREEDLLSDLQAGKEIALISDAGTPGISDPGSRLVEACLKHNIPVTAIPGPCAAIQALSCSGLDTDRFQFLGFLPRKAGELKQALIDILSYPGTTICYESPHRLLDVLELLAKMDPERSIVIARELTKTYEEFLRGSAETLRKQVESRPLKGEIVLLIKGQNQEMQPQSPEAITPAYIQELQDKYGLTRQEAIKFAAKTCGVSKRDLYQQLHQKDLPHKE